MLKHKAISVGMALLVCAPLYRNVWANESDDPSAVKESGGEYYDKGGNPTYKVKPDGTVDWYTFSGYLRYNSNCNVCHGPDGSGSSYAPSLKNSAGLRPLPGHGCAGPGQCLGSDRLRHAVLRQKQKRRVLSRRYLCLSARPLHRRRWTRPAGETQTQAARLGQSRRQLHGTLGKTVSASAYSFENFTAKRRTRI